jgi:hemolysin III
MSLPKGHGVCFPTLRPVGVPGVGDFYGEIGAWVAAGLESGSVSAVPALPQPLKPRLRGVFHQWACVGSVPLGLVLVIVAGTARARIALIVYSVSLVALFGVSGLYHRIGWRSLTGRDWMRRLDHSMIFVLIAGSYTPFAVLVLHGPLAVAILVGVWAGASLGVAFNLVWRDAPTWLRSALYVGLGWIAVAAVPQLGAAIGLLALTLVGLGGVLYTLGAVVYATKRPDPLPAVFGYHELFHVLVIAAAALQYAVIAFWIAPA